MNLRNMKYCKYCGERIGAVQQRCRIAQAFSEKFILKAFHIIPDRALRFEASEETAGRSRQGEESSNEVQSPAGADN